MSYLSKLISYKIYIFHTRVSHIGAWMASVLTTSKVDRGLVTGRVKEKTIKQVGITFNAHDAIIE